MGVSQPGGWYQQVEMPLGMVELGEGVNPCPYTFMISVTLSSSSWLLGNKENVACFTAFSSSW